MAVLLVGLVSPAQTISDIDLRKDVHGRNKLKKAGKKVFIAEFRVMYQMMYAAEETKKGSVFDDGAKGSVTAYLALGLSGLKDSDLVDNTNHIYQQFVKRIEDAGYEVITAASFPAIKEFNGWEKKSGGGLSNAQFKGFVMSTPTNFEYFVKGTKEDGREKKTFTDNSSKISYQAGNVMVIRVNLVLPMAENSESWASGAFDFGGAKVVATPKLSLSNETIVGKGFSNAVNTGVSFVNSEAMSLPTSIGVYNLKNEVMIDGVVERKKYKSEATADYDVWGGAGPWKVFEFEDRFMRKVIPIPVEAAKYNAGVRLACDSFLKKVQEDYMAAE